MLVVASATTITTTDIRDMLKRQRQVTPPPSSLGDPPLLFPDGPIRPLHLPHTMDPCQPRAKRQRTRPPPLDGALRGWLESDPAGPRWESDGEEDWIEDAPSDAFESPLPQSSITDLYKGANSLLHELHILNQHRLLFSRSSRDRHLDASSGILPPTPCTGTQDPLAGQTSQNRATWIDGSSYHSAFQQPAHGGLASRTCLEHAAEKGLVEEVQCVRQHYEDTNRFLGSLFLSRRREVEEMTPSADASPSG